MPGARGRVGLGRARGVLPGTYVRTIGGLAKTTPYLPSIGQDTVTVLPVAQGMLPLDVGLLDHRAGASTHLNARARLASRPVISRYKTGAVN